MAGGEYTVRYNIQVNLGNSTASLQEFARVTGRLRGAKTALDEAAKSVQRLNSILRKTSKNTPTWKINVEPGIRELKRLQAEIERTAALARENGTTLGAFMGGGRGRAAGKGKTTKAVAASSTSGKTTAAGAASNVNSKVQTANGTSLVAMAPPPSTGKTTVARPAGTKGNPVYVRRGGANGFMDRVRRAGGYQTRLGPAMIDSGGTGAINMLKGMGIMYGITGLGSLMGGAIRDYSEYNNTMVTTRGILSMHDNKANFNGRFKAMEKKARNIGRRTKFTAPEVASATRFLAMAGLDLEGINNAIEPITDIALVGDTDLGETADLVTNIMTAYRKKPSEMRKIADKMTMAFTMSNTTLPEMAESYKYVASIAAGFNLDFDDITAAIGLLGDAGIKGTSAGSALRRIVQNIYKPTKAQMAFWTGEGQNVARFDENGNMRNLFDIFKDLSDQGLLNHVFDMFRLTAAPGAMALGASTEKWLRMKEAIANSDGASSTIAKMRTENIQGMWKQITSSITENFMQTFEALEPKIKEKMQGLIQWLQSPEGLDFTKNLVDSLMKLIEFFAKFTVWIGKFYQKFKPLIDLWLQFQMILTAVIVPLRMIQGVANAFGVVLMFSQTLGGLGATLGAVRMGFLNGGWKGAWQAWQGGMRGVQASAAGAASAITAANTAASKGGAIGTGVAGLSIARQQALLAQRGQLEQRYLSSAQRERLGMLRQQIVTSDYFLANRNKMSRKNQLKYVNQKRAALNGIRSIYSSVVPGPAQITGFRDTYSALNQRRKFYGREIARIEDKIKNIHKPTQHFQKVARLTRQLNSVKNAYSATEAQMGQVWRGYRAEQVNESQRYQAFMQGRDMQDPSIKPKLTRWQRATRPRFNMGATLSGMTSMVGAGLGGYLGSQIGKEGSALSMIGGIAGGAVGMAAMPWLISNPVGWGILAIGALATVGKAAYDSTKTAQKASEALASWGENMRIEHGFLSGSATTDMEKHYQLMFDKNMSINQVFQSRIELLQRLKAEESGGVAPPTEQDYSEAQQTNEQTAAKAFSDLDDSLSAWDGEYTTENMVRQSNKALRSLQARDYITYRDKRTFGFSDIAWTDSQGRVHEMPNQSQSNVASMTSAYKAGWTDPVMRKQIVGYQEQIQQLFETGTAESLSQAKTIVEKLRTMQNSMYQNIPSEYMPENWNEKQAVKGSELAKTFFFRDAQAALIAPTLQMFEKKFADLERWKAAQQEGKYTISDVFAYLNAYSKTDNPALARLAATGDVHRWYQDIGYNENTRGWQGHTWTDAMGNQHSVGARESAELFLVELENFKKMFEALPPSAQIAVQSLYDLYSALGQNAQQFLNGVAANLTIPPVSAVGQLHLQITEANGHYGLDAYINHWAMSHTDALSQQILRNGDPSKMKGWNGDWSMLPDNPYNPFKRKEYEMTHGRTNTPKTPQVTFASGGVIEGPYTYGDRMLARVNAGEMVLNQRQQANLFNMIDEGIVFSQAPYQSTNLGYTLERMASRIEQTSTNNNTVTINNVEINNGTDMEQFIDMLRGAFPGNTANIYS